MRRSAFLRAGFWLVAIAVVHLGTSPLFYAEGLTAILEHGVIHGVESGSGDLEARAAAFWYVASGLLLLPVGMLCVRLESAGVPLPGAFGWLLLGFSLCCAALLPYGGFWLFLAPAVLAIRSSRRRVVSRANHGIEPHFVVNNERSPRG